MKYKIILLIFSVHFLVRKTESYRVIVQSKDGTFSELKKPIHIDAEYVSPKIQRNLKKQLDVYPRNGNSEDDIDSVKIYTNSRETLDRSNKYRVSSPVVYADGRYTLDLEKLYLGDPYLRNKRQNNNLRENTAVDNTKFRSVDKIVWDDIKKQLAQYLTSKNLQSLRKQNEILLGDKKERARDSDSIEEENKRKKKNAKKRFKVVSNYYMKEMAPNKGEPTFEEERQKKKKKKKKKRKKNKEVDDVDDGNLWKKKKKNKRKYEEVDKQENMEHYLQGGQNIVNFYEDDKYGRNDDWRKRLQHFLPKRYHWDPNYQQELGYFWFNGPKGKYPEPMRVD